MAQWEWIIIELLVLGVLVYELISVRRSIRQARGRQAQGGAPAPLPGQGTAEPARRWGAGLSGRTRPSAPAPRNPER